jgi:hypothetical protein
MKKHVFAVALLMLALVLPDVAPTEGALAFHRLYAPFVLRHTSTASGGVTLVLINRVTNHPVWVRHVLGLDCIGWSNDRQALALSIRVPGRRPFRVLTWHMGGTTRLFDDSDSAVGGGYIDGVIDLGWSPGDRRVLLRSYQSGGKNVGEGSLFCLAVADGRMYHIGDRVTRMRWLGLRRVRYWTLRAVIRWPVVEIADRSSSHLWHCPARQARRFLYVPCGQGCRRVYQFRVDADGHKTPLSPSFVSLIGSAYAVVVSPDRRSVYVPEGDYFSVAQFHVRRNNDPPTVIPPIARLAGFCVGVDTIEAMERRLGRGEALPGGHPNGARSWWLRGGLWHIWCDGFDYHDDGSGRVVDSLSLDEQSFSGPGAAPKSERRPLARASRKPLGWMGVVIPGMTVQQVLQAIKGRLPPPQVKGSVWRWEETGFVRVSMIRNETFTDWTAEVAFVRGRVSYIWLSVG